MSDEIEEPAELLDEPRTAIAPAEIQVRDITKREVDMRLLPWDFTVETIQGPELFRRGAFNDAKPSEMFLYGAEHEMRFGVGQDGQPKPTRVPIGRGVAVSDNADGPHATFRVARTSAGDENLALMADGIVTGVSVEFSEVAGGTQIERVNGRRTRVHTRAALRGATPTHRPAYGEQATVLAVRSQQAEGDAPVAAEPTPAPEGQSNEAALMAMRESIEASVQARAEKQTDLIEKAIGRIEKIEEQARSAIDIPNPTKSGPPEDFHTGDWAALVLRMMSGEHVSDQEVKARVAAELITADNLGVIPDMFTGDVRETIETTRPFLETTRQLTIPRAGMQLNVPILETRPTVGVQAAEKDELTSTTTSITSGNFSPVTIGGYGDISLQLLKRSDPSYLELYLDLLAEAYGIMSDDKAVDALLAAAVNAGGALDPENLLLGAAWENGVAISRRLAPDRIWMSSAAVSAFIDAKAPDGATPLYSNLQGNFTAAGGAGGTVSGLRPVHVPALDDEAVDVIVGPSRGFGWAEDGTYTLQVDVPAKAGRDVGLVGMIWFAPLYPAAFTTYTVGS